MAGPAWLQNPNEVGEKNWSRALRIALGFGNFHYQLMLNNNVQNPVPAVDFADSIASVGGLFNQEQKNLRNSNRIFHHKVQRYVYKLKNHAQNR